ncbi:MAG: hypothetical protein DRP09_14500 [Candidatus Thorarchaeota archaeon]|nr:MAG: hypothetical protein DRP09_14500 [Candidatus Thorarchaeota archaeon]
MNDRLDKEVVELIRLVTDAGPDGIPLQKVLEKAGTSTRNRLLLQTAIDSALDLGLLDKIVGFPKYIDGVPFGDEIWILRVTTDKEREWFRNLPDEEKAVLRILQSTTTDGRIGSIREETLLLMLKNRGFDLEFVPIVPNKVEDEFTLEDKRLVRWFYLVPSNPPS